MKKINRCLSLYIAVVSLSTSCGILPGANKPTTAFDASTPLTKPAASVSFAASGKFATSAMSAHYKTMDASDWQDPDNGRLKRPHPQYSKQDGAEFDSIFDELETHKAHRRAKLKDKHGLDAYAIDVFFNDDAKVRLVQDDKKSYPHFVVHNPDYKQYEHKLNALLIDDLGDPTKNKAIASYPHSIAMTMTEEQLDAEEAEQERLAGYDMPNMASIIDLVFSDATHKRMRRVLDKLNEMPIVRSTAITEKSDNALQPNASMLKAPPAESGFGPTADWKKNDYKTWYFNRHSIFKMWDVAGNKGNNLSVAVIEPAGFKLNRLGHPTYDMAHAGHYWQNWLAQVCFDRNVNVDMGQPLPFHGTAMAHLIGAKIDGNGICGVAPDVSIIPIRNQGAVITSCIDYARLSTPAKVINISQTYEPGHINLEYHPDQRDALTRAYNAGISCVICAGNDQQNLTYDASKWSGATIVGGTAYANSDLWPQSAYGNRIDLCAAGEDVLAESIDGSCNDTMSKLAGTSCSAAIVSGMTAILRAQTNFNPNQVRNALIYTSDVRPTSSGKFAGWGLKSTNDAQLRSANGAMAAYVGYYGALYPTWTLLTDSNVGSGGTWTDNDGNVVYHGINFLCAGGPGTNGGTKTMKWHDADSNSCRSGAVWKGKNIIAWNQKGSPVMWALSNDNTGVYVGWPGTHMSDSQTGWTWTWPVTFN